jgi:hypothetical protein
MMMQKLPGSALYTLAVRENSSVTSGFFLSVRRVTEDNSGRAEQPAEGGNTVQTSSNKNDRRLNEDNRISGENGENAWA